MLALKKFCFYSTFFKEKCLVVQQQVLFMSFK
ncbi:hypothetical protein NIASO_10150 [Niabella soli DSM 19437]|uniref:Uncharacterized protein n=1 Tax=Niabella soli DSM 19437 TaxID=929713 RepID=W0F6W9_9BACT|nr:hypothetical protein NIASO_10150 [Niabella soli DSM 19437]